ncbi:MAG: UvrD-helicase domain-containing protein [Nitrospira sp.]|uniref:DNA 3'-5' helicase II n=1 Tax=Nitrospira defluvii TaxID=330214 RepID=A0ABN7LN03_9BACT|nr:UvrD-helicase domain-containing protein [Nitrospira defluvii]MCS6326955.1 UvrD-helicase domain-containing protein [Nitrospira sp.]CAE6759800.1 DNA-dependent helicase II [Nitrospira defluvii]
MANFLTLAVAGSRKTQGIVEHCASLPHDRRALVLTYTQTNQAELRSRLASLAGDHPGILVMGWFTFLLRDFARPFLPFQFAGCRVFGFNFEGRPHRMAKGPRRFLDSNGYVYSCELGRLAHELVHASGGALLRRLECIYDEILIDEVQDLSGHDWEIIDVLLRSALIVHMVGDIRQAVLSTNPRSPKNKRYAYASAVRWFRERENRGELQIIENNTTWRCHPEIATFSDSIFDSSWSFPQTQSLNKTVTKHDGVFLIHSKHVAEYVARFRPRCLRDSAHSGKAFDLNYVNFRLAKGMTCQRVLIVPTAGIKSFIQSGTHLDPVPASKFYVAVTRAEQSVTIVIDEPGYSQLPYWDPSMAAQQGVEADVE